MAARDDIGTRGEFIFCARIMDFCGREFPFFRPRFLGEKARTVDYLIQLVGMGDQTPFFFVQVKATRKGYTRAGKRLKVSMSGSEVGRFSLIPAPTYLVGIDEAGEAGYIVAILHGMVEPIASIPTDYPLDCTTLPVLYQEVERFWAGRDMARRQSAFAARGIR
jgi:hypothetical protein